MATIFNYNHQEWFVTCITNGTWKQNCYILKEKNSDSCIIIDPGSEADSIIEIIDELDSIPIGIYNTHGHYDHIGAVDIIKKRYKIPFYVHSEDSKLIKHANLYRIIFDNTEMIDIPKIDQFLNIDHINFIDKKWKFSLIYTPGHTEGSCCFMFNNIIFTGDTLLNNGPGRTDLPGGDKNKIIKSIEKLKSIDSKKLVFPGHGKPFTLASTAN